MTLRHGLCKHTVVVATLTLLLAGSQDLVALHNEGELQRFVLQSSDSLQQYRNAFTAVYTFANGRPDASVTKLATDSVDTDKLQQTDTYVAQQQSFSFKVPQMRCEGCASHLRKRILESQDIVDCVITFASREVKVWVHRGRITEQQLIEMIQHVDPSYAPIKLAPDSDKGVQ